MADGYNRKFPADQGDKKKDRITTGCQYCAVGCGYNAFLVPEELTGDADSYDGVSRFISPSMTNTVTFRGRPCKIAVAPDVRCDLNKGNHSVRGGSQGENLVTHDGGGRSTQDRLRSPFVRLSDGKLHEITWDVLEKTMARLLIRAADIDTDSGKIRVGHPERVGAKVFEYQYLENTYAASKFFYSALGTPNVAYHDRPSAAGSSPGMKDAGLRPFCPPSKTPRRAFSAGSDGGGGGNRTLVPKQPGRAGFRNRLRLGFSLGWPRTGKADSKCHL